MPPASLPSSPALSSASPPSPHFAALSPPPPASTIYMHECRRRGIAVAYAADFYSDDCADSAVGLLINVLHRVSAGDRFVRNGNWSSPREFPTVEGQDDWNSWIGKKTRGLWLLNTVQLNDKEAICFVPILSDVCELAATSDFLVICSSLTDQTWHMINKEVLSALGKKGVIINVARGPILDEKELVRSLQEGEIAGAGLDVFENEPKVPQELFALDNVVLSPHSAFSTKEAFCDMFELVKANLHAFFSNKPLISPVVD